MFTFDKIRTILTNKGYMPTNVTINTKLNAVVIRSGFALSLYHRLRALGSEVSFNKPTDEVLVFDDPNKFEKVLGAL